MQKISRLDQVQSPPQGTVGHQMTWLEGPFVADRLDVGLARLQPGAVTPAHSHRGGQVIVAVAGQGFVECDGTRLELAAGDVAICSPGELHVHGALDGEHFSHLTITTGQHDVPPPG